MNISKEKFNRNNKTDLVSPEELSFYSQLREGILSKLTDKNLSYSSGLTDSDLTKKAKWLKNNLKFYNINRTVNVNELINDEKLIALINKAYSISKKEFNLKSKIKLEGDLVIVFVEKDNNLSYFISEKDKVRVDKLNEEIKSIYQVILRLKKEVSSADFNYKFLSTDSLKDNLTSKLVEKFTKVNSSFENWERKGAKKYIRYEKFEVSSGSNFLIQKIWSVINEATYIQSRLDEEILIRQKSDNLKSEIEYFEKMYSKISGISDKLKTVKNLIQKKYIQESKAVMGTDFSVFKTVK